MKTKYTLQELRDNLIYIKCESLQDAKKVKQFAMDNGVEFDSGDYSDVKNIAHLLVNLWWSHENIGEMNVILASDFFNPIDDSIEVEFPNDIKIDIKTPDDHFADVSKMAESAEVSISAEDSTPEVSDKIIRKLIFIEDDGIVKIDELQKRMPDSVLLVAVACGANKVIPTVDL